MVDWTMSVRDDRPIVYTGETEPRGGRLWVPASDNGRLIKHNIKKIFNLRPKELYVYTQIGMNELGEYEWPDCVLFYAEGITPKGRWKDERVLRVGIDDL